MNRPRRILITAGPTHEPIDTVRYLTNRSSGRLGIALAEQAAGRGHETMLLLGPTHLEPLTSSHLKLLRFRTTDDLRNLLKEQWPNHDMLIMAAAVADYRPRSEPSGGQSLVTSHLPAKISRSDHPLTLHLEPTPDLLAELALSKRNDQMVVGFALEPAERLLESARGKLVRKQLDAIIANPLEAMDADSMPPGTVLLFKDGRQLSAPQDRTKPAFATWLLDALIPV